MPIQNCNTKISAHPDLATNLALTVAAKTDKATKTMYSVTLMLLVANLANTKSCKNNRKMTETLAHGYYVYTNSLP